MTTGQTIVKRPNSQTSAKQQTDKQSTDKQPGQSRAFTMKPITIDANDVVYVPFRLAHVSKRPYLIPKNIQYFVVKNSKAGRNRFKVQPAPSLLYLAQARTPQVLIDYAMENNKSSFKYASLALGHNNDCSIDQTFDIIRREYSKIRATTTDPIHYKDDIYEEDVKKITFEQGNPSFETFEPPKPVRTEDLCDFYKSFDYCLDQ